MFHICATEKQFYIITVFTARFVVPVDYIITGFALLDFSLDEPM